MRDRSRRTCVAAALGFALAACGGRTPAPGGLVVGAGADSVPSGAFQARLGVYPLNANIGESLVRMTPDFALAPALAVRWQHVPPNTWRFTLREGVRFHDGEPLTAEAARSSLLQTVERNLGYSFLTPESFRVVGPLALELTPSRPNFPLPHALVHPNYSIFSPECDPSVRPMGTGPYRLVEYEPYQRLIVARSEEYWGEPGLLPRIEFRFFPDSTTRVLALLAGDVDLAMDVPREQMGMLAARPGLRTARAEPGLSMSLYANVHGVDPYDRLSDPGLRRAVAVAIDRHILVETLWRGEARAVQNMTVPQVLGRHASLIRGFPYDPSGARAALEAAGWRPGPDGVRRRYGRALRLVIQANPETDAGTVEFLQAQLKDVGIDLSWSRLSDVGAHYARVTAGEFDLNLSLSNQNDANPLFLPALIFYSESRRPFTRWHAVGPAFDRLVEEGLAAFDHDVVQRTAAEAMRIAIDGDAVVIPLAALTRLYAHKDAVVDFAPHPSQTHQSWTRVRLGTEGH